MKKLLKIRFVKFEKALATQVLEQEGKFEKTEHIRIRAYPATDDSCIFLRGWEVNSNFKVITIHFETNTERDEYLDKVVTWISEEQFATGGKLEIGKECEASDNGEDWFVRSFAGKSAKQLGDPRYLAYWYDNLGYLIRYKYVRPLASFVRPKIDGDVYTWEMEAKDEQR